MAKRITRGRYFKKHWNTVIPSHIETLIEFLDRIFWPAIEEFQNGVSNEVFQHLENCGAPSVFKHYSRHSADDLLMRHQVFLIGKKTSPKMEEMVSYFQLAKRKIEDAKSKGFSPHEINAILDDSVDFFITLRALTYGLICHINFKQQINDIALSAQSGKDQDLFKLIQVDKAIINEPWVRKRIYKAQMKAEKLFFFNLSRAIQKDPLSKIRIDLRTLLVISFLDIAGVLNNLSYKQISDFLFDKEIAEKSEDAIKMLMKKYHDANKVK